MIPVPCATSFPASANICDHQNNTYSLTARTDDDGKMFADVKLVWGTSKNEDVAKLEAAAMTAPSGAMVIGWANADVTEVEMNGSAKKNGKDEVVPTAALKCEKSIRDHRLASDDATWKACKQSKCF